MINSKFLIFNLVLILGLMVAAAPVSAHVVVKPAEVGIGQRLNFAVSVPTEEENPTTMVRLVLPDGLTSVRPNVKPGWNIQLKKSGEGDEAKVTEIVWSGGNIPRDQRDEFVFSAQAPASESTLNWKAYQTYSNGMTVAWDSDPKTVEEYAKNSPGSDEDDHNAPKPYSMTKVINDLAQPSSKPLENETMEKGGQNLPLILSALAVIIAGTALALQFRKS